MFICCPVSLNNAHSLQAQSNNELDSLYRQHSVNINLLTNSMESVMANLPKVNLLESPTVEDSDTERLDIVMVTIYHTLSQQF